MINARLNEYLLGFGRDAEPGELDYGVDSIKWVVTVYSEHAVYEPAEGGYYYPVCRVNTAYGSHSRKDALRLIKKMLKEAKATLCSNERISYSDDLTTYCISNGYIGEDITVCLESIHEFGQLESDYQTYC